MRALRFLVFFDIGVKAIGQQPERHKAVLRWPPHVIASRIARAVFAVVRADIRDTLILPGLTKLGFLASNWLHLASPDYPSRICDDRRRRSCRLGCHRFCWGARGCSPLRDRNGCTRSSEQVFDTPKLALVHRKIPSGFDSHPLRQVCTYIRLLRWNPIRRVSVGL